MFASCVKNISLRIFALHKCTAAHKYWILENWRIARRIFYVLRRNHFYHSWTAVGCGAIRLKRYDWRKMKELNSSVVPKHSISFFLMMLVWKNHWFQTKFFDDKQALANHRQELIMWRKTTRALTLWQSQVWCSKSNSCLTVCHCSTASFSNVLN